MTEATLSIRISRSEIEALRRRARRDRLSQGAIVRRALRAYGVTSDPDPGRTGYDVIRHLLGSCSGGTPDLSSNPRHLEGYGR